MPRNRSDHRLSIIIPTLNEAEGIESAVWHALALGPHEVLVVDGHSEDETVRIARSAGARVIAARRRRATQQNAGAAIATGDLFLFLHADTWLAPSAAEQIRRALRSPKTVAGAFRQQIGAEGVMFRALEWGNGFRARLLSLPYGDQGIFVRREVFEELGGFPEVGLMEDLLLMRRVRRVGHVALLPGPLHVSARRWQRYGVIRQTWRNWSLLTAERFGVSPDRLAWFYPPHTSDSSENETPTTAESETESTAELESARGAASAEDSPTVVAGTSGRREPPPS